MRILITGDRRWYDPELAEAVIARLIDRFGAGIVVVHGAAPGIDESFAEACREMGIDDEPHPADWDRLGPKAGPTRNQAMVSAGADMCLAFHRELERSKGTKDCVRRALRAGIACYLIADDSATPKRIREGDPRLA